MLARDMSVMRPYRPVLREGGQGEGEASLGHRVFLQSRRARSLLSSEVQGESGLSEARRAVDCKRESPRHQTSPTFLTVLSRLLYPGFCMRLSVGPSSFRSAGCRGASWRRSRLNHGGGLWPSLAIQLSYNTYSLLRSRPGMMIVRTLTWFVDRRGYTKRTTRSDSGSSLAGHV